LGNHQPAVRCQNPLKRWSKGKVVRGNLKGRTFEKRRAQPKYSSGVRDGVLKQQLRLGSEGYVNEVLRHHRVVKLAAGSSVSIKKISVRTL
jgi:hypothetical protein